MNLRSISLVFVCCAAGAFASSASSPLSSADKHFMNNAADDDMIEAHLGKMAESHAAKTDVKDFAKQLADDHSKAYGELLQLANTTGDNVPRGIDIRRDHEAAQLTRLSGERFDRLFLRDEIAWHEKAIAAFRREAAHGTNPQVKAMASQMIPVLERHLERARQLAKSANIRTAAAGTAKKS
jgi:putative membrane protein